MELDKYNETIAALGNASNDDLTEALAAVRSEYSEIASKSDAETVERKSQLAADLKSIRAEMSERVAISEQAQRNAELDAVFSEDEAAEVKSQPKEDESSDKDDKSEDQKDEESTPDAESSNDSAESDATNEQSNEENEMTVRQPLGNLNKDEDKGAFGQINAHAIGRLTTNLDDMSTGTVLDEKSLIKAFMSMGESLRTSGGTGGRHTIAKFSAITPESRQLGTDASTNAEKIRLASEPSALTAAGLCAPCEVIYDVNVFGVDDRPIRDGLARYEATRGCVTTRLPFDVLNVVGGENGIGIWTIADDVAGTAVKQCYEVPCGEDQTVELYSTYLCLTFSNVTARFDPEGTRARMQQSMVAWARYAENLLLQRILGGSTATYVTHAVGATADLVSAIDRAISYYRWVHRLSERIALQAILPRWIKDEIRTDMARRIPSGDGMSQFTISDADIDQLFADRSVSVIWHLDGLANDPTTVSGISIPNQTYTRVAAGQELPGWPVAVDMALFEAGTWKFLDGGTLDLGMVRDSALNSKNRYQQFTETFEGVLFDGVESLRVVIPLTPNGASSGTVVPDETGAWSGQTGYAASPRPAAAPAA